MARWSVSAACDGKPHTPIVERPKCCNALIILRFRWAHLFTDCSARGPTVWQVLIGVFWWIRFLVITNRLVSQVRWRLRASFACLLVVRAPACAVELAEWCLEVWRCCTTISQPDSVLLPPLSPLPLCLLLLQVLLVVIMTGSLLVRHLVACPACRMDLRLLVSTRRHASCDLGILSGQCM